MANHSDDETFDQVGADASKTFPKQCSALRKNDYVVIKDHACKIVDMSTSKTGKHGHAKVHLTGLDVFTGKKYEDICPSTHSMNVPNVTRKEYQVHDVNDGFLTLMDENGDLREDLKYVPTEGSMPMKDLIEALDGSSPEILAKVLSAMGEEHVMSVNFSNKK